MIHGAKKPTPKLRKAPQPPLSRPGASPDSDRAKKPPLGETRATNQELEPGDRVEGLGNFGKPTGEVGTVERTNEEDAVVKWDDAVAQDSTNRRSRRFSRPITVVYISDFRPLERRDVQLRPHPQVLLRLRKQGP